jgi:hypothetical protein
MMTFGGERNRESIAMASFFDVGCAIQTVGSAGSPPL